MRRELDLSFNLIASGAFVQELQSLPSRPHLNLAGNPVSQAGQPGSAAARQQPAGQAAGRRRPLLPNTIPLYTVPEAASRLAVATQAKELAAARVAAAQRLDVGRMPKDAESAASQPPTPGSTRVVMQPDCDISIASGHAEVEESCPRAEDVTPEESSHVPAELLESSLGSSYVHDNASSQAIWQPSAMLQGSCCTVVPSASCTEPSAADIALKLGLWNDEGDIDIEAGDDHTSNDDAGDGMDQATDPVAVWSESRLWDSGTSGTDDGEPEQYGLQDPTIRLALQLGLDPLRLALFGDLHSRDSPAASNPQSAVNTLKYALQHRPTVSMGNAQGTGNHLRGTSSTEAKRRYKFSLQVQLEGSEDEASSPEAKVGRLHSIDALLAAMKKRLDKVEAQVMQEISAVWELCSEELPLAAGNTLVSPSPQPQQSRTSSLAREYSQGSRASSTMSRLQRTAALVSAV
ncbi:hypothetical protein N2152v2_003837 [Parachlorella kessleri]